MIEKTVPDPRDRRIPESEKETRSQRETNPVQNSLPSGWRTISARPVNSGKTRPRTDTALFRGTQLFFFRFVREVLSES